MTPRDTATAVSLDLDAIASRAASLCRCDDPECRSDFTQLADRDVPALFAEVERLRAERDRTVEYCRNIEAAYRHIRSSSFAEGSRNVAVAVLEGLGADPLAVTT